jgi:hemolysin III
MEVTLHADGAAAETANSITHGLGAVLSVLALVLLTVSAALRGSARHVVGCVIFGCTLVLLYTMSTLYHALRGGWGWSLFGVVWGLAALGVAFKSVYTGRFEFLSTAVYLAMSWMVLIAAGPLWRALPARGLAWLLGGGVCYTGGVVFYGWHRLKFHHAVWHLFVLAGSLCHVVSVIGYVIPRGRP